MAAMLPIRPAGINTFSPVESGAESRIMRRLNPFSGDAMGQTLFVVLKEERPETKALASALGGAALGRQVERLDVIAERLGQPPLLSFFSADPAELAEAMNAEDDYEDEDEDEEEDEDADEGPRWGAARLQASDAEAAGEGEGAAGDDAEPEYDGEGGAFLENWYAPAAGLETVRALIDHVAHNPGSVGEPEAVVEELQRLEEILAAAEKAEIPFHIGLSV
jgi:hypothetical protein